MIYEILNLTVYAISYWLLLRRSNKNKPYGNYVKQEIKSFWIFWCVKVNKIGHGGRGERRKKRFLVSKILLKLPSITLPPLVSWTYEIVGHLSWKHLIQCVFETPILFYTLKVLSETIFGSLEQSANRDSKWFSDLSKRNNFTHTKNWTWFLLKLKV